MKTTTHNKKEQPHSHRISIYVNDDELAELKNLASPWNLPRALIFRKLLFNSKQVMLDTQTAMGTLDRIGLALETANEHIKLLRAAIGQPSLTDNQQNMAREQLLHALQQSKASIDDCSKSILQLIKKI